MAQDQPQLHALSAIAGQLAGALYGETGLPAPWRQKLCRAGESGQIAEQLAVQNRDVAATVQIGP